MRFTFLAAIAAQAILVLISSFASAQDRPGSATVYAAFTCMFENGACFNAMPGVFFPSKAACERTFNTTIKATDHEYVCLGRRVETWH